MSKSLSLGTPKTNKCIPAPVCWSSALNKALFLRALTSGDPTHSAAHTEQAREERQERTRGAQGFGGFAALGHRPGKGAAAIQLSDL